MQHGLPADHITLVCHLVIYLISSCGLEVTGRAGYVQRNPKWFSNDAAKDILEVPLIDVVKEDSMVWREEQHDQYSVRTGYRLPMRERGEKCNRSVRGHWSSLWKIRAPPKTKHLLWRISRDCLPTRLRLRQHYAKALIHDICHHEEREVAGRFGVMIWMLWNNRNDWLWNKEKKSATQIGMQAFQTWSDWSKAQNFKQANGDEEQAQQQHTWQPPRIGSNATSMPVFMIMDA
ncbi:hypothetical protein TSUD_257770 [Trifolium subterraneum]|uniref:Reverse transcriptase zinc-binding domain-containing protein n=1 Tax=Trifolium subterraneum TaxID=3900 RepID=A0A2Z6M4L3_TRISU|nr:hypothetical protein TSUD_257770 [Trifolium subterraneum]